MKRNGKDVINNDIICLDQCAKNIFTDPKKMNERNIQNICLIYKLKYDKNIKK